MSINELFFRVREILIKTKLSKSPLGPLIKFDVPTIEWNKIKTEAKLLSNAEFNDKLLDIRIYGFSWPRSENGSILWNCFLDGADTSELPTFTIPYRNREQLNQDIRFSWELNRLTWLFKISAFGSLSERENAARLFQDFLRNDKVGFGIRWNSMIELAVQAISIQIITTLLDGLLVDEDLRLSNEALSHRFFWIKRLPSRYSSANNHRLAELVALISLAESSRDSIISERSQRELIMELSKQTLPDGFNAELSAAYHLFVLDLLITLNTLCPNLRYSAQISSYIEQMVLATHELRVLNQIWPAFGDSDEAALLATLVPSPNRSKFLESVSGYIDGFREEASAGKLRIFKESGFSVACSNSQESRISLLVDHGLIGFGKIAAHGHADTLGIWLVFNEFPVLVEAGNFSYHSSESTRDLLRSGWMHNTITVDGESLSQPSGPFLWLPRRSARGKLLSCEVQGENIEIQVAVDFPRTRQHKLGTVNRKVKVEGNEVRVLDSTSAGETIESHFILSPHLKLARGSTLHEVVFASESGVKVTFITKQPNAFRVEQVEISPSYGSLIHTHRLTAIGHHANDVTMYLDRME